MEQRFEIFADYFQFYLQDDDMCFGQQSQDWSEAAVQRMLVTGPHLIGVGTAAQHDRAGDRPHLRGTAR
jgi:hypothetical protein